MPFGLRISELSDAAIESISNIQVSLYLDELTELSDAAAEFYPA